MNNAATTGWGLIAGNGRFPFLVLEGARSQGIDMAVIALKEEASQELANTAKRLHWVSLGELSKAIDLMHSEGVTQAVMAGQVKHNKIFSTIRPDWKLAKLLFSLSRKNTDSLIGAVAKVFEEEGIHLVDSTHFLKPLLPEAGVLTRRAPDEREAADIADSMPCQMTPRCQPRRAEEVERKFAFRVLPGEAEGGIEIISRHRVQRSTEDDHVGMLIEQRGVVDEISAENRCAGQIFRFGGLRERRGLQPARPSLRVASARDQAGALEHLEVL